MLYTVLDAQAALTLNYKYNMYYLDNIFFLWNIKQILKLQVLMLLVCITEC